MQSRQQHWQGLQKISSKEAAKKGARTLFSGVETAPPATTAQSGHATKSAAVMSHPAHIALPRTITKGCDSPERPLPAIFPLHRTE